MDLKNYKIIKLVRIAVQGSFALFCLYIGYRFFCFYEWAIGNSDQFIPRPPSVEAFLPISALLGLRKLIQTGQYDMIHPAGLTIFIAAIAIAFVFRKGFCGWICPVGFLSNTVERIGRFLKVKIPIKRWIGAILGLPKYALLAFFLYVIFFKMDLKSVDGFIQSPYNIAVDAKMLKFFLHPSSTTIYVISFLAIASLFVANIWCRYLCPYGAFLGIISILSPTRIKRDPESCINCKRCNEACPSGIAVSEKLEIFDPDCIGCEECVASCPKKGCLTPSFMGRSMNPFLLPIGVVGLFLAFWVVAKLAGLWDTVVPPLMFKKFYSMMNSFGHPSF